jgi:hypothetical protein
MFGQNNTQTTDQTDQTQVTPNSDDQAQAHLQPVVDNQSDWGHPGVPIDGAPADNAPAAEAPVDNGGEQVVQPTAPAVDTQAIEVKEDEVPAQDGPAVANDLIDIKQKALTQLSPLVGHLEQSPEEKFRTTMMMIQASDDQSLIPVAYEAANSIQDEKVKAQALLDIVNEINYFTQHHQG